MKMVSTMSSVYSDFGDFARAQYAAELYLAWALYAGFLRECY